MIRTSRQLKAMVRNLTKGDSIQAQIIIRNYVMERFLERISLSKYRNNFILKGGMLVSAMVGIDTRSTMDIDTTIKNLPLTVESAREEEIRNPFHYLLMKAACRADILSNYMLYTSPQETSPKQSQSW